MNSTTESPTFEPTIAAWRARLLQHPSVTAEDVDELEDHLRSCVNDLSRVGLTDDEALMVAFSRLGSTDALTAEFAHEHSDRLWKQRTLISKATSAPDVVAPGPAPAATPGNDHARLWTALMFGVLAGLSTKVVSLFGLPESEDFYQQTLDLSLYVAPWVAGWLAWWRRPSWRTLAAAVVILVGGTALLHVYFGTGGLSDRRGVDAQLAVLGPLSMPVVAWCAVGLVHMGGQWRSSAGRMDFIRFTGEWVIYYGLIALGGQMLVGIAMASFSAVGVNPTDFLFLWIVPLGTAGATVIAAYLVEAKKSVIENMAPVLTKVFTPLAALLLLALLGAMAVQATKGGWQSRELLIVADVILVLVVALLVYAWSARDREQPAGWFEGLQLGMVIAALVVDVVSLAQLGARVTEWGLSPYKAAALGLNVILLVNLAWSAVLLTGFLRGRRPFGDLERWQTSTLPFIGVWAAIVLTIFPLVFSH